MKVKIGNIEISDVTLEELDQLVERYGNSAFEPQGDKPNRPKQQSDALPAGVGAADTVLLRKLVEAGTNGVTTIDIGTILGRQGKAARPALKEWSKRVGLVTDDSLEAFEEARVGTQRGLRLKTSLIEVARHIMGNK